MASLLVINGPNLNLLGQRQPDVYGAITLEDIQTLCVAKAEKLGANISFFQSNHEGQLIDAVHGAKGKFDGLIMNAGAYTHTSVAIMDAISSVDVPAIEVHLSNIHAREAFRRQSYISAVAIGQICGFGADSYLLAIEAMINHLSGLS